MNMDNKIPPMVNKYLTSLHAFSRHFSHHFLFGILIIFARLVDGGAIFPFRTSDAIFATLTKFFNLHQIFSAKLKEKGNYVPHRTPNRCFLTSLLYHYTNRLIRQFFGKLNYNALINVKSKGGGGSGKPREFDWDVYPQGGDFYRTSCI